MAFRKLMLASYRAWEVPRLEKNESRSQGAFATEFLGISPGAFSNYLNGKRVPRSDKELAKLAMKLGQVVYDALDIPRPDPRLRFVIKNWGLVPDGVKKEVKETIERAIARSGEPQPDRLRMEVPERK